MNGTLFDRVKSLIARARDRHATETPDASQRMYDTPRRPLVDTAAELAAAVDGIEWSAEAVQGAARRLGRDSRLAATDERAAALDVLVNRIKRSHVDHADGVAHVAISAGALIEHGAPAYALGDTLLQKMPAVLTAARRFADMCLVTMGEPNDAEGDVPEEDVATYVDDRPVPWTVFRQHLASDRPGAVSLAYLREWTLPTVAALTRDRKLLIRAAEDEAFCSTTAPMDRSAAGWLHALTGVQLDAPWLVLFPLLERGFRVTVDGVTNNFELHALVADTLIAAGIEGTRNARDVIAVLRGEAQTCSSSHVSGAWNLYTHGAAGHDLSTPNDVPREHWVWGEGQPRDVPAFEDMRTLLVGPAAYIRSWGCGRTFSALPARVDLVTELSRQAVRETLGRIAGNRS